MAKQYTLRVTVDQAVQRIDLTAGASGRPVRIRAVDGARYQLGAAELAAGQPSQAPPTIKVRRVGQDLHLYLDDSASPQVILEGYHDLPANTSSAVLGQGPDGVLHEYVVLQDGFGVDMASVPERAAPWEAVLAREPWGAAGDTGAGGLVPLAAPGVLAAVAGGAVAVAAAGGGGGDGAGSGPGTPTLTPEQALQAIREAADANNASDSTVPLSTYTSAGVSGVNGSNLAAIHSALNSAAVGGAQVDTAAKVQAVVDAYNRVLNAADGTDGNAGVAASASDYATLGVVGVTAATAGLVSDVVDGKRNEDVDTVAELQALADAASVVMAYDEPGADAAPTAAQLNLLVAGQVVAGKTLQLDTATDDAMPVLLAKIAAANNDGAPIVTQSELAQIVGNAMQAFNAAKSTILIFADEAKTGLVDAPLPFPVPQLTDYQHLGITGVSAANLHAINDALASEPVGAAAVYTPVQLQALVNAYNLILAEANDLDASPGNTVPDAMPGVNPTAADYQRIGVTLGAAATDAENLALLNDIVGASQKTDVDTIAELNQLARIANAVQTVAAGGTPSVALQLSDLTLIGLNVNGLTSDSLPALMQAIAAKTDSGTETDTLQKLQAIVDLQPRLGLADVLSPQPSPQGLAPSEYLAADLPPAGQTDWLLQQAQTTPLH